VFSDAREILYQSSSFLDEAQGDQQGRRMERVRDHRQDVSEQRQTDEVVSDALASLTNAVERQMEQVRVQLSEVKLQLGQLQPKTKSSRSVHRPARIEEPVGVAAREVSVERFRQDRSFSPPIPRREVKSVARGDVSVSCPVERAEERLEPQQKEKINPARTLSVDRQRRDYVKLDKFDGGPSLETFLIHLATCSEYNGWSEREALAQLKASLRGPAAQVLLCDDSPITYDSLIADLRNNFGTKGFESQFENQLKMRRRRRGESLQSLYQDVQRLILLAYPESKGPLRDKFALESFINGLNDSDLSLKVRNLCPSNLSEGYRVALMLESNQILVGQMEESKAKRREDRFDVQARSVGKQSEDLQGRVRALEEASKPMPANPVVELASLKKTVACMESGMQELRELMKEKAKSQQLMELGLQELRAALRKEKAKSQQLETLLRERDRLEQWKASREPSDPVRAEVGSGSRPVVGLGCG